MDIKDDLSNADDVEARRYKVNIHVGAITMQRQVVLAKDFDAHVTRLTAERDGLLAEVKRLDRKLDEEEGLHSGTIDQRDRAQDAADEMAYAIGKMFRVDVGEHSNLNCPWHEACSVLNGAYETDSDIEREVKSLQSELTKAWELLARIRAELPVLPRENWWVHIAIDDLLAHQSAPATKGE